MPSVLVVEDDADSRDVLSIALRKAGHTVTAAPNGREALVCLADGVPDVAIVDLMMPEMDGIQLVHVIRSYLRWRSLPVILLTAHPDLTSEVEIASLRIRKLFAKTQYALSDLLAEVDACAKPIH